MAFSAGLSRSRPFQEERKKKQTRPCSRVFPLTFPFPLPFLPRGKQKRQPRHEAGELLTGQRRKVNFGESSHRALKNRLPATARECDDAEVVLHGATH